MTPVNPNKRSCLPVGLVLLTLAGCEANSGAVAKPLIFESSAKRAAAIRGQTQGVGAAGSSAERTSPVQPGSSPSGAAAPATGPAVNPAASSAAGRGPSAAAGNAAPSGMPMQKLGAAGAAGVTALGERAGAAGSAAPAESPTGTTSGAGPTACNMMISYTAVGMHGMWYPHNIGAVWVEDASGKFIKTLERWAGIRAGYLANWNEREDQHGTWPSCPFANVCTGPKVPDQTDVVSQATIFEDNAMHMAKWSCKDLNGELVPDGKYKLFFEEMENIYPAFPKGPLGMVDFEKGPMAATLSPPDQAPFKNLKIVIEPVAR